MIGGRIIAMERREIVIMRDRPDKIVHRLIDAEQTILELTAHRLLYRLSLTIAATVFGS